jgi:glycosyltransferase involved in cell wall biosynthesis
VSRVLLLCPEPLGHQHPAGVGIRFIEMARALRSVGHTVTILSPDGGAVDGCAALPSDPLAIRDTSDAADVAVVQGHAANDYFAHARRIPTVVDLYDPFIVENLHYYATHGPQVFAHDHATIATSLRHGDLFLCASPAQRLFYLGMLLAIGRLNPAAYAEDARLTNLVRIVPFGVPPLRPPAARDRARPRAFFGGIYDWYAPSIAIEAVRIARATIPELTLTFTKLPNAELTPQSVAAATECAVRDRGDTFVTFEPWAAYEDRAAYFDRFAIALLTFEPSLETDLAMRTRLFDFLWAGLPVLTSPAPGTDDIVTGHSAGRVVPSNEPADFARVLVEILGEPAAYERAVAGGRAWAAGNQWPTLLEPLLQFCAEPRFDDTRAAFPLCDTSIAKPPESLVRRLRRKLGGTA